MDSDDRREDNISPEERKVWQHLVLTDPGSPALLSLARDYLDRGIAGPALVLAQRIRTAHPYHLEASTLAALALLRQNKDAAARELTVSTVKSLDGLATVLRELADLAARFELAEADRLGRVAALLAYSGAKAGPPPEESPGEPVPTETLAALYLNQGLKDQAARIYRKLLEKNPGEPRLQAKLRELEPTASPTPGPALPAADSRTEHVEQKMKTARKLERLQAAARRRRDAIGTASK
ncbi:MAG: hypothetical protein V1816_05525 [Pseudomonadota bacterium]